MKVKQIMVTAALLAVSTGVLAASFDCAKAGSKAENLVCSDARLSASDSDLSAAYQAAIKNSDNPAGIKQDQISWIKNQRDACATVACMQQVYDSRISVLTQTGSVQPAPAAPAQHFAFAAAPTATSPNQNKQMAAAGNAVLVSTEQKLSDTGNTCQPSSLLPSAQVCKDGHLFTRHYIIVYRFNDHKYGAATSFGVGTSFPVDASGTPITTAGQQVYMVQMVKPETQPVQALLLPPAADLAGVPDMDLSEAERRAFATKFPGMGADTVFAKAYNGLDYDEKAVRYATFLGSADAAAALGDHFHFGSTEKRYQFFLYGATASSMEQNDPSGGTRSTNLTLAKAYYDLAIRRGSAMGMYGEADLFLHGAGGPDVVKALPLYESVALKGNKDAMAKIVAISVRYHISPSDSEVGLAKAALARLKVSPGDVQAMQSRWISVDNAKHQDTCVFWASQMDDTRPSHARAVAFATDRFKELRCDTVP